MAGLTGQQVAVEGCQFRVGAVGCQQGHALVAAGLDQAGHQQAVQQPLGFLAPHQAGQAGAVGGGGQGPQRNLAADQQALHQLEMLQLFAGQGAEHGGQLAIGGVAKHQLQSGTGRLALAVGVVDQHGVGVGQGLLQPGGPRGGRQPLDPFRRGPAPAHDEARR